MTITDAMIEAGARALCRSDQLSPDALVTNLTAFRGKPLWKTYAVKAKAALEAAERAAWRPIEEADPNKEYLLFYPETTSPRGKVYAQKAMTKVGRIEDIPRRPTHFRPLPTPGETDVR